MPCIFCIAVFMLVAGTIAASAIDHMQASLEAKAGAPVRKTVDSGSVAKLETVFEIEGKVAPVAVTIYKASGRARIQILTHDLSPAGVRSLQDEIAMALGARIVDRTDMSGGSLMRETPPPPAVGDEQETPPSARQEEPRSRR
jgi:hypothetical protein